MLRLLLWLLLLASITSWQKPDSIKAKTLFSYVKNLGVASIEKGYPLRLFITNNSLIPGDKILLVYAGFPQWSVETEVITHLTETNSLPISDYTTEHSYQLKPIDYELEFSAPMIAITKAEAPALIARNHLVTADLDGDSQVESFRQCTSHEGIHLTVWTGKPLQGRRRWHYYYDLSFDVEPSCKEIEYREP